MEPRDPSMLHSEENIKMPLAHLYHLAHDPYNEVTPSIEEIVALKDEYGWDYEVEGTIKIYKRPEQPAEQPEVPQETVDENTDPTNGLESI